MRVARPIVLKEDIRRKLEQQARGRSTAARVVVVGSRIVLLAADGLQNKQIAATLKVAPRMVTLWRGRFLEQGIEGLPKDAPRPGRTPSISAEVTATLIAKTTQSTPVNATQWSTRTMAKEMSISKASVSRIAMDNMAASTDPATNQIIVASNGKGQIDTTSQQLTAIALPLFQSRIVTSQQMGLPNSLVFTNWDNVAPRLGVAYQLPW